MLSCKEVAKIISSGEKLGLLGRLKLSLHLLLCKHCSNYSTEIGMLENSVSKNIKMKVETSKETIKRVEKEVIEKHTGSNF